MPDEDKGGAIGAPAQGDPTPVVTPPAPPAAPPAAAATTVVVQQQAAPPTPPAAPQAPPTGDPAWLGDRLKRNTESARKEFMAELGITDLDAAKKAIADGNAAA